MSASPLSPADKAILASAKALLARKNELANKITDHRLSAYDDSIGVLVEAAGSGVADSLLDQLLPKVERYQRLWLLPREDYALMCRLAESAADRQLLERVLACRIRLDVTPQFHVEDFARRQLGRGFTRPEAEVVLERMTKRVSEGTTRLPSGAIVPSPPIEEERVAAFARDHGLDVAAARMAVRARYAYLKTCDF